MSAEAAEATIEAAKIIVENVEATRQDLILMFVVCVAHMVIQELVGQYYIYSKEEYGDNCEKARNLGRRLKKL